MSELENVTHEGNRAGWITDDQAHNDGLDHRPGQEAPSGIGLEHSISPSMPCPETLLVAVMTDGSYILMGYPQGGPAAFITAEDADPLRQALQGAFETTIGTAASGNGRHTGSVLPGHDALRTEQVQL